jgi:hypothetical protein
MVKGTIHGIPFQNVLEPDGNRSHWLAFDADLQKATRAVAGSDIIVTMEPTDVWVEPEIPDDLEKALKEHPTQYALWSAITPSARWDWIRWIRATNVEETRKRRIAVALSKLKKGERRPCCFNRNTCTVPEVSKSGALIEPTHTV